MVLKEKVENILGGFLERNKNYVVHVYLYTRSKSLISRLTVPIDRNSVQEEKRFLLKWNSGVVEHNDLKLPYGEIMDCYEERDEYNQQTVGVILHNGMKIEFECCGDR